MTDETKIEPALSAEEWAKVRDGTFPSGDMRILPDNELDAGIAYLNDRLPDSDPRKITRAWVNGLRHRATNCRDNYRHCQERMNTQGMADARAGYELFEGIADALASYLPPEGT